MTIVITGLRPAVQMKINFSRPRSVKLPDLLRSCRKGREMIVLVRRFGIVKFRIRLHHCLDSRMNKAALNQLIHTRVLDCFLLQCSQISLLPDVFPIYLAKIVIITPVKEGITKNPRIPHGPHARDKPLRHLRKESSRRMLRPVAAVPGGRAHSDITCTFLYLTKPWHVGPGCQILPSERDVLKFCLPAVRDQESLTDRKNGIPGWKIGKFQALR